MTIQADRIGNRYENRARLTLNSIIALLEESMGEILDLAEALWKGEKTTYAHHPLSAPYGIEKVAEGTWFQNFFPTVLSGKPRKV